MEAEQEWPIDAHYLSCVRLMVFRILDPPIVQVTGWIDEVVEDVVKISYRDEDDRLVYADVPLARFYRFSELSRGAEFLIQSSEQAGEPRCEFLPRGEPDEKRRQAGRARVLARMRNSLAGRPMPSEGQPEKPRDWSDHTEVQRYHRELEERYKNIDWGKGRRT